MKHTPFALTTTILCDARLKSHFCRTDVHEEEDQPDRLWLEYTPDDARSEGEYITIEQYQGYCEVTHEMAHNYGGQPTVWRFTGSESEVLCALVEYLPSSHLA